MANLKDFMTDPEVKKLVGQAKSLSGVMFKTHDSVNWERLNEQFHRLLNKLEKKTGMKSRAIHMQLADVQASTKRAPAKRTRRKLAKAYLDDDATLIQLIDMAAESGAYEEPAGGWKVTKEIEREVTKFERELQKALDQWTKKRPLKGMFTTDTLMDANGGYLVFMTLRGEGVGIWDGDWDEFFENDKDLKDLEKFLEQKLRKYADHTGGGSLNQAIDNAAYEQAYGAEASARTASSAKGAQRRRKAKRAVAATQFFVVVADGDAYDSHAAESLERALDLATFDKGTRYTIYKVTSSDAGAARMPYEYKKGKVVKKAVASTKKRQRKHHASFKGAVPGNLADNTKPSTPASQMQAVELLKQGGILPEDQKPEDYPVLTAQVKREIIATLLKRKQPKLATWASRNLPTRKPVRAAKNYASVVFLQNDFDFNDFRGSGGKGQEGFFDSDEKEMMKYLQQWDYGDNYGDVVDPMMQKGTSDYTYKKGRYMMTYNPGLGYAGLYVKAAVGASKKKSSGRKVAAASQMMFLDEEDWDEFAEQNPQAAKRWKGYYFKMTYGVVTEESAQEGDYAEHGWEVKKSSPSNSLEELLEGESAIRDKSWLEWSSSSPRAGDWITSQEEQDYSSGDTTTYDLFIERADKKPLSKEEMQYISRTLGVRM